MLELLNLYSLAADKAEGYTMMSFSRLMEGKEIVTVSINGKGFVFHPNLEHRFDVKEYKECIEYLKQIIEGGKRETGECSVNTVMAIPVS